MYSSDDDLFVDENFYPNATKKFHPITEMFIDEFTNALPMAIEKEQIIRKKIKVTMMKQPDKPLLFTISITIKPITPPPYDPKSNIEIKVDAKLSDNHNRGSEIYAIDSANNKDFINKQYSFDYINRILYNKIRLKIYLKYRDSMTFEPCT